RKALGGSSRTVFHEGSMCGPGDTSHRRGLQRLPARVYSIVRELPGGATLVIEARRGLRSVVVANVSAIGCIGVITVATRGTAGPGEVLVKIRGGSEAFIAWSPDPLPRGTSVLVIDERGSRTVDVSAWADPLQRDPASSPQP